jgi:hypothetical protein
MALRSCLVSCRDLAGTEHAVEVTAESLYEAVAQALGILRGDIWVEEIGEGLTELKVRVKQPTVEHLVRMKDFRRWLESQGRTPAECTKEKEGAGVGERGGTSAVIWSGAWSGVLPNHPRGHATLILHDGGLQRVRQFPAQLPSET